METKAGGSEVGKASMIITILVRLHYYAVNIRTSKPQSVFMKSYLSQTGYTWKRDLNRLRKMLSVAWAEMLSIAPFPSLHTLEHLGFSLGFHLKIGIALPARLMGVLRQETGCSWLWVSASRRKAAACCWLAADGIPRKDPGSTRFSSGLLCTFEKSSPKLSCLGHSALTPSLLPVDCLEFW